MKREWPANGAETSASASKRASPYLLLPSIKKRLVATRRSSGKAQLAEQIRLFKSSLHKAKGVVMIGQTERTRQGLRLDHYTGAVKRRGVAPAATKGVIQLLPLSFQVSTRAAVNYRVSHG